ncbi:Vicilin-like antimicrobial peptides 2-2 [Morella rubra]|uniref:Vicilin-like antimicrobial peptides 2-2 n=1 Tax=Morella rubra TaxID=262757 RepID=A0A6A1WQS7_9ROSI|nr:Vicilin-like antimicrobial peptides 2-2 [Morella rubra]
MGYRAALLVLVLVLSYAMSMAVSFAEDIDWREREGKKEWRREREERERMRRRREEGREREWSEEETDDWFLLQESKPVMSTDAGEMRVVKSFRGMIADGPMHIGFITMEPKTLFIPQYLDSSLIIFIRRGEAKIGYIYRDELAERPMKTGDLYRIPAGSTFYLVNTALGQRLHVIASIDPSEGLGIGPFQSFFIGGGTYPNSVLAGFGRQVLSNAFNVSEQLYQPADCLLLRSKRDLDRANRGSHRIRAGLSFTSVWTKFFEMKEDDRLQHLKTLVNSQEEPEQEEEEQTWSWIRFFNSMLGKEVNKRGDRGTRKAPDSYNLYTRRPDFRNKYGWSVALDESDYRPLKHSGIGVYLVNLTAGSMMAPHVNPTATEYGIVLSGSGSIRIVFPNGTTALNAEIAEGDVFWVPRYFPFCQIASRTGPLEFFGFTTSARRNRPQFLAGASSVLRTMLGPELAAGFGVDEETLRRVLDAQREAVILPSPEAAPPDEKMKRREREREQEKMTSKSERVPKVIKSSVNDI